MLYPVRFGSRSQRQFQEPTILAALTGDTYALSVAAIKKHRSGGAMKFPDILSRCGFHVERQYTGFDGTVAQWINARPEEIKSNSYLIVTETIHFRGRKPPGGRPLIF